MHVDRRKVVVSLSTQLPSALPWRLTDLLGALGFAATVYAGLLPDIDGIATSPTAEARRDATDANALVIVLAKSGRLLSDNAALDWVMSVSPETTVLYFSCPSAVSPAPPRTELDARISIAHVHDSEELCATITLALTDLRESSS